MAFTVKIKQSGWTVVPADVYLVKVKSVEELDMEFGPTAKFAFEILDGDYAGESVEGLASVGKDGISPKSKLYGWLLAILGSLDEVEEANLDSLVGKRCRITVTEESKTTKDGSAMQVNKITTVLPAPRPAKKPAVAAAKPADEDAAEIF
jgi:hypothetical protein